MTGPAGMPGNGTEAAATPRVDGLVITYRPVGDLRAYGRNARTHSAAQIDQIVASIREFGWTSPILVDPSGEVIAGHGRLAAAQQMELRAVPTIEIAGLTSAQRRALVLADNKLALNAGWDSALLGEELRALTADGFAAGLIGFSEDELAMFLPVPPVAPGTEADQGRLDQKSAIACPHCGQTFIPS